MTFWMVLGYGIVVGLTDTNIESSYCAQEDVFLDEMISSLGFLARAVYLQIGDMIRSKAALTVSPPMLSALRLIHDNPGIRQVQVARILLTHESNTATLVRSLVGSGLIQKQKEIGKRSGLSITDVGRNILEQSVSASRISREYAQCLTDEEYCQLITLLGRTYRSHL